jgi:hypothetical protein
VSREPFTRVPAAMPGTSGCGHPPPQGNPTVFTSGSGNLGPSSRVAGGGAAGVQLVSQPCRGSGYPQGPPQDARAGQSLASSRLAPTLPPPAENLRPARPPYNPLDSPIMAYEDFCNNTPSLDSLPQVQTRPQQRPVPGTEGCPLREGNPHDPRAYYVRQERVVETLAGVSNPIQGTQIGQNRGRVAAPREPFASEQGGSGRVAAPTRPVASVTERIKSTLSVSLTRSQEQERTGEGLVSVAFRAMGPAGRPQRAPVPQRPIRTFASENGVLEAILEDGERVPIRDLEGGRP